MLALLSCQDEQSRSDEPGATTDCYQKPVGEQYNLKVQWVERERITLAFVLDDSPALEAQLPQLRRAVLGAVRRSINPACSDRGTRDISMPPADPFAECPEGQQRVLRDTWDRWRFPRPELEVVLLRGSRPGSSEACSAAFQQHGGLPLRGSRSIGVFSWRPSELNSAEQAVSRQEELLAELEEALEEWQSSTCPEQQPLEALYDFFAAPDADEAVLRARQVLRGSHHQVVLVSGTDDSSTDTQGRLYPIARYDALFSEISVCHDRPTLTGCAAEERVPNPLRVTRFDFLGPQIAASPCASGVSREVNVGPAVGGTRLAELLQAMHRAGYGDALCLDELGEPYSDSFLLPVFTPSGGDVDYDSGCSPDVPIVPDGTEDTADGREGDHVRGTDGGASGGVRVDCLAFQQRELLPETSCDCDAIGLRDVEFATLPRAAQEALLPQVVEADEGLDPYADSDGRHYCYCEIPQLEGRALRDCQHERFETRFDEPVGFCYVDVERGANPDLAPYCSVGNQQTFRVLGWRSRENTRTTFACRDARCTP